MDKKICSICGEEKPLTDFHKDKRGILGVRADCKVCRSSKTRKPKELHLPNVTQEVKECEKCGEEYKPNSNRQMYCLSCQNSIHKARCNEYHKRTYKKIGYSHLILKNANAYKTGIGIYQKLKKMSIDELKCERCESTNHLLVHHKDRDRDNNEISNLELLCKACHQQEHMIRDENGKFIGSK